MAYIDEKELEVNGKTRKEYYSVLVKADAKGMEQVSVPLSRGVIPPSFTVRNVHLGLSEPM